MAEQVEDVPARSSSWMPLALVAAFVAGAALAGWFIFGDDLRQWSRIESMAWAQHDGERLHLVQHERVVTTPSSGPPVISDARLEWLLAPSQQAQLPGQPTTWEQVLRSASVERRRGQEVVFSEAWTPPEGDSEAMPAPLPELSPDLPPWMALLPQVIGLPLTCRVDDQATLGTSSTAPEVLEQIASRRTGEPLADGEALGEGAIRDLHDDLATLLHRTVIDVGAPLDDAAYRPGQTWHHDLPLPVGPWGRHEVRVSVRLERYEGDIAVLTGFVTRVPSAASLGVPADGLAGLNGEGSFRFDVAVDRPVAGHLQVEARGKIDQHFATIEIERAWALGAGESAPALPAAYVLDPLPPTGPDEAEASAAP